MRFSQNYWVKVRQTAKEFAHQYQDGFGVCFDMQLQFEHLCITLKFIDQQAHTGTVTYV